MGRTTSAPLSSTQRTAEPSATADRGQLGDQLVGDRLDLLAAVGPDGHGAALGRGDLGAGAQLVLEMTAQRGPVEGLPAGSVMVRSTGSSCSTASASHVLIER